MIVQLFSGETSSVARLCEDSLKDTEESCEKIGCLTPTVVGKVKTTKCCCDGDK